MLGGTRGVGWAVLNVRGGLGGRVSGVVGVSGVDEAVVADMAVGIGFRSGIKFRSGKGFKKKARWSLHDAFGIVTDLVWAMYA